MTDKANTTHFAAEATGVPSEHGRFVQVSGIEALEFLTGLEFRPVLGGRALANFVSFAPHTEAPLHVHEEEQLTIILDGELEFTIDGETRTMRPGDVAVLPSWVPHGARTLDAPCTVVDVFTPPRKILLDHARQQVRPADAVPS